MMGYLPASSVRTTRELAWFREDSCGEILQPSEAGYDKEGEKWMKTLVVDAFRGAML